MVPYDLQKPNSFTTREIADHEQIGFTAGTTWLEENHRRCARQHVAAGKGRELSKRRVAPEIVVPKFDMTTFASSCRTETDDVLTLRGEACGVQKIFVGTQCQEIGGDHFSDKMIGWQKVKCCCCTKV